MDESALAQAVLGYFVRPVAFFDLDGTIRRPKGDHTFIANEQDIMLFDGVEDKLRDYQKQGFVIWGISNQGGVAFNHRTPDQVMAEVAATVALFERNPFAGISVCFFDERGHHALFGRRSLMRKPDIGMLVECERQAYEQRVIVDWANSFLVGDRPEDEECARRANIAFRWAWEFFGREQPVDA